MLPLVRLNPFYPGQFGIPGSDNSLGLRQVPQSKVLYVDYDNPGANDNNDGTDPNYPLATIQEAVNKLEHNFDVIRVRSIDPSGESVVTPDYATGPSYVTLEGVGDTPYSPYWVSRAADTPCLDMRAVGWRVTGFRFGGPTAAACIELRHTDSGANDIAIRTIIENNLFDGLTVGLAGIITHGCYDVWIRNNIFQLFNNAGNTATCILVGATPLAIPYRCHIVGNIFWDCDNGVDHPCNGCEIAHNRFQPVGYAYSMTVVCRTSLPGNPGDDNIVWGNLMPGDYSIAGGYIPGAADVWVGNFADDVAEAEVGDNGLTIARPT